MKDFRYNAPNQQAEVEYIVNLRKKKIARQQIIFLVLFIMAVGAVLYYVIYNRIYTTFDGYVHVDVHAIRAPDDIVLLDILKDPGAMVHRGDTLYSYIHFNHFLEQENLNTNAPVVTDFLAADRRWESAVNSVEVTRAEMESLRRDIEKEDHNIALGLSDNKYKLDLERKLVKAEESYAAQQKTIAQLKKQRDYLREVASMSYQNDTIVEFQRLRALGYKKLKELGLVRYRICIDEGIVTNINSANRNMLFKGEEVMTVQMTDMELSHLRVEAYVPFDKMKQVRPGTPATVIVNDWMQFKVHVVVQGARVEDLPSNLRSNFSRNIRTNITLFAVVPGQQLPFWVVSEGLPVKVRINNLDIQSIETVRIIQTK